MLRDQCGCCYGAMTPWADHCADAERRSVDSDVVRHSGQCEQHAGAAVTGALDPDPAAVRLDHVAREVQPEAHARRGARLPVLAAVETLEDERQIRRIDARTMVAHAD